MQGWGAQAEPPTQLIFLRHGETPHTVEKRFSGSGGDDPALSEHRRGAGAGRGGVPVKIGGVDAVVVVADAADAADGRAVARGARARREVVNDGWVECSFGDWDGHTFAEVQQKWPDALNAWMESTSVAPPGGESFDACARRARSARDGLLAAYPGKTVARGHPRDADQADGPIGAAGPDELALPDGVAPPRP